MRMSLGAAQAMMTGLAVQPAVETAQTRPDQRVGMTMTAAGNAAVQTINTSQPMQTAGTAAAVMSPMPAPTAGMSSGSAVGTGTIAAAAADVAGLKSSIEAVLNDMSAAIQKIAQRLSSLETAVNAIDKGGAKAVAEQSAATSGQISTLANQISALQKQVNDQGEGILNVARAVNTAFSNTKKLAAQLNGFHGYRGLEVDPDDPRVRMGPPHVRPTQPVIAVTKTTPNNTPWWLTGF